jgi:hypothetical protein
MLYYDGKKLNKRYKLKEKTLFNALGENKKLAYVLDVYQNDCTDNAILNIQRFEDQ